MALAQKKMVSRALKDRESPAINEDDQYFSRAVGKAFGLLKILSRASGPLSLSQVSTEIGLTKSSAYRLLYTLQTLQYVSQDADGHYVIAGENRLNAITHVAGIIVPLAQESMQALNMKFQETVSLAVLFNNHIEVVEVLDSPRIVRMANTVGRILPPHASSLGKSVTAFQSEAVAKKLIQSYGLPQLTPATIVDEMILVDELRKIREQGYAFEAEESTLDGCCFGCPIFLDHPVAVAAMSISMPKSRLVEKEDRTQLIKALQDATQLVSKKLRRVIHHTA